MHWIYGLSVAGELPVESALLRFDFDAICDDASAATSTIASLSLLILEQVTAPRCQMLITVAEYTSIAARNSIRRMHSISRRIVPIVRAPRDSPLFSLFLSLSADLKGVTFNDHRRFNHRESSGFVAEFAAAPAAPAAPARSTFT